MNLTYLVLSVFILVAVAAGCSSNTPGKAAGDKKGASNVAATTVQPQTSSNAAAFAPFYVYQDKSSKNRFTPSGYMPDGNCISVDDGWQNDVKVGRSWYETK